MWSDGHRAAVAAIDRWFHACHEARKASDYVFSEIRP